MGLSICPPSDEDPTPAGVALFPVFTMGAQWTSNGRTMDVPMDIPMDIWDFRAKLTNFHTLMKETLSRGGAPFLTIM